MRCPNFFIYFCLGIDLCLGKCKMSIMKRKWMPMRLVKPGTTFVYGRVKFVRIRGISTIGKEFRNLIHIPSGELGFIDGETAVKV